MARNLRIASHRIASHNIALLNTLPPLGVRDVSLYKNPLRTESNILSARDFCFHLYNPNQFTVNRYINVKFSNQK